MMRCILMLKLLDLNAQNYFVCHINSNFNKVENIVRIHSEYITEDTAHHWGTDVKNVSGEMKAKDNNGMNQKALTLSEGSKILLRVGVGIGELEETQVVAEKGVLVSLMDVQCDK